MLSGYTVRSIVDQGSEIEMTGDDLIRGFMK